MDVESGQPILLSQENENEMYKLTYDSDDSDEINAPATPPKRQSTSGNDTRVNMDSTDAKEKSDEKIPSPNVRKTKDMARYEGNRRLYSLFSNENFVTEDPKRRRKTCWCVGIKTALFISTIVVLSAAIIGLMWVVRGMQVENEDMERRITKLEVDYSTRGSSSSTSSDIRGALDSMIQNPQSVVDSPESADPGQTSDILEDRVEYLSDVLKSHAKRFSDLESKLKRHTSEDYTHKAEVRRIMTENSVDVETAFSEIQGLRNSLKKVEANTDTAKHLALFAMKNADMTEEDLTKYLGMIHLNETEETVAFSIAHAEGDDLVVSYDYQEGMNSGSLSAAYYDVRHDRSPVLSFTEESVDTGEYITPDSGIFHAPSSGTYAIFISFCVQSNIGTSVHLLRNGKLVRSMKAPSDDKTKNQVNAEAPMLPLGFLLAPSAINPGDPPLVNPIQDDQGLVPPPIPDMIGPLVEDYAQNYDPLHLPVPESDKLARAKIIHPHQFTEIISLEGGDTLSLKIAKGSIVEYLHQPGTDATQESCTRFSGYKL